MSVNRRRQVCSTKRKRLVQDRRKKIVERRHIFYKHCAISGQFDAIEM